MPKRLRKTSQIQEDQRVANSVSVSSKDIKCWFAELSAKISHELYCAAMHTPEIHMGGAPSSYPAMHNYSFIFKLASRSKCDHFMKDIIPALSCASFESSVISNACRFNVWPVSSLHQLSSVVLPHEYTNKSP